MPSSKRENNKKPLEGKVAEILNDRELVINIGRKAGANEGMRFKVLDEKPVEIVDPDTKRPIGTIDRPKVKVKVVDVEKSLCIARTYETYEVNTGGSGSGRAFSIGELFAPKKMETRVQTLRAQEWAFEPLGEESSFINIGDRVQQIIETEEESES